MLLDDHDEADEDDGDTATWEPGEPIDDLLDGLGRPNRLPARTTGTVELEQAAHAGSTRHRYSAAWGSFYTWCQVSRGLPTGFDATHVDVREYVHHLVTSRTQPVRSVSTIRVCLAAITWAFEERDLYSPARHPHVRRTVRGTARLLGTARRQPTPLRLDELRKIVHGLPLVEPHSTSSLVLQVLGGAVVAAETLRRSHCDWTRR